MKLPVFLCVLADASVPFITHGADCMPTTLAISMRAMSPRASLSLSLRDGVRWMCCHQLIAPDIHEGEKERSESSIRTGEGERSRRGASSLSQAKTATDGTNKKNERTTRRRKRERKERRGYEAHCVI